VNQGLHLRVSPKIVGAFDEDQPMLATARGHVEFPLGRRDAFRVLKAVLAPEQAHVHIAALHFVQVHLVGAAVGGWDFLKQKQLEESPQQRIAAQIRREGRPLGGELLLHTAHEQP
jgi:hypothetical protein